MYDTGVAYPVATHQQVRDSLEAITAPALMKERMTARISADTMGLLLYGSRARDDYLPSSDWDVLRLSQAPHTTFSSGKISVSTYTREQLESASGSLFGTHLLRDGRIILDPNGLLAEVLSQLRPAVPEDLLATVRRYSVVLNMPANELAKHTAGLVRLGRYLLRTAIYARTMRGGEPCFSVRDLAYRFSDPALAILLASNPEVTGPPTREVLIELISRLTREIGALPTTEYKSLESLAIGFWNCDRNISALSIRAAREDGDIDYSDLPKVLL